MGRSFGVSIWGLVESCLLEFADTAEVRKPACVQSGCTIQYTIRVQYMYSRLHFRMKKWCPKFQNLLCPGTGATFLKDLKACPTGEHKFRSYFRHRVKPE